MILKDLSVYPAYYTAYFQAVPDTISIHRLLDSRLEHLAFYESIPEERWSYAYETGKWSIQNVVRHIIDAELIFDYRALSFVRGEKNKLMGWSENEYAAQVDESRLNKESLLRSLELQMRYTADLFAGFDRNDLQKIGNMNNHDTEVGGIGFAIIAHEIHHRGVIQNRYL